ncbi:hypothetical protein SHI21_01510 [Bacteriovorax sp. PP10]|uniref:Uncharacterized protein n=1 Tax=Bacteriovorax antarcticus TaxID=3088717 RepID=A0ABU5VPA3_9BACT|nr:hypothetical protein [Bacteriovorax sp. PP10]MEA9354859.1 hypothetical protein [Bacteriovorax sp. PP10]
MNKFFRFILIALLGIFVSCSTNSNKKTIDYTGIGELQTKDYIDHLAAAGGYYLAYEETKTIKLRPDTIEFLESIYDRLVSNNQLILNLNERPTFYIIQHKSPFLFSLPRSQFFFSTALIERYLKSEELFVAAFAAEVVRSQRYIYEKKIMLPLGFYNTEKMIGLTKLKFDTKQQVSEWTYFVLKRAGYDASAYLNWIQIQNRNTLDFSMYLGDSVGISKEEHLFKNFMTKQGVMGVEKRFNEANSSKNFYKLLNNVASRK